MSTVLGVFAHPDDEAFFTGGTIATLAQDHDVYTICITNGDAGENSLDKSDSEQLSLEEIRKAELLEAAKILGIKKTFFLGYKDGTLSNNLYHEIAGKIKNLVDDLKPEILITFEPRGVTGHIDHVATSMITSYVFERAKSVKELWYFCYTEEQRKKVKEYFIYWPPGYGESEISKKIDIESIWETKVRAMHAHASQRHDVDRILSRFENLPKEENFQIIKK